MIEKLLGTLVALILLFLTSLYLTAFHEALSRRKDGE